LQVAQGREGAAAVSEMGSQAGPAAGFFGRLEARVAAVESLVCVGLDPHASDVAEFRKACGLGAGVSEGEATFQFCARLIDATAHAAAAYKPNAAFFEALGLEGFAVLERVVNHIPREIPVVLDNKRGDISTTAAAYAAASFDKLRCECVTLHPYMGWDSVEPFVGSRADRGAFVLCKTSNPSSNELETLALCEGGLLYERVARLCASTKWNAHGNLGLVVGATDTEAMRRARAAAPGLWILAPGVGFQGGDLETAAAAGLRADGLGLLVPISRGISRAEDPRAAFEGFRAQINEVRRKVAAAGRPPVAPPVTGAGVALAEHQTKFFQLALSCGVLKFGSFTLKSGRTSPYFFNAGLFASGKALDGLGRYYAQAIVDAKVEFDVLFGPAYKGIPLAAVVALSLSRDHGRDVPFAYNRKEAKDHGEGGVLVGASVKGKKVLVVDDVITAGTAIRESIDILGKEGGSVAAVVIALDRQERASDTNPLSAIQGVKKDFGIDVVPIVALDDLLGYLKQSQGAFEPQVLAAVEAYRAQYGVAK
jgi:uridine monophosphate synthetase